MGTILLMIAIAAATLGYILTPLFLIADSASAENIDPSLEDDRYCGISDRIEAASRVEAIRDLELDYALGKLSEIEFTGQVEALLAEQKS